MERKSRKTGWLRRRPREDPDALRDRRAAELLDIVDRGWAVAPAAHPVEFGCSCERVGCPSPGMHPMSSAWQTQATTTRAQVTRWLDLNPDANWITPTGITHDVIDVPADAGELALAALEESGAAGPVLQVGPERYLFFTATRGTPDDEDEWWPCDLDCHPESIDEHPGVRWHCRGSYVLVPPSVHPSSEAVRWLRSPDLALPDPLRVLDAVTDACETVGASGRGDSRRLIGM